MTVIELEHADLSKLQEDWAHEIEIWAQIFKDHEKHKRERNTNHH